MQTPRHRVLSGIQPSGTKHLGNYFGAMRQFLELQDEFPGQTYVFIADYHALTTLRDPGEMQRSIFDLARTYLSIGLDPDKTLLFRQSDVPEVTELTWLLTTVTGMGLLERAHSYKDKIANGIKPSVGLFTYPVLMAADILIYDSTLVPVGKDQVQHVEIAQDIATHFNQTYGKGEALLVRPEVRLSGGGAYVTGTDGKKMSTSYGNTIPLFESGKKLKKLLGKIVTDSTPLGQPLDPDTCNVFSLLKLFLSPDEQEQVAGYYRAGAKDGEPFGYGHAKQRLAGAIEDHFAPARARMAHYEAHPEDVEAVLRDSAAKARPVARATLDRCKRACGLIA
ncbi:MAG: tryptophan--tRNA ligase [Polyangiaceae bacterium]